MKFLCILTVIFLLCTASIALHGNRRNRRRKIITNVERIGLLKLTGPESFVWDPQDSNILYTGVSDGSIKKVNVSSGEVSFYAYTAPNLDNETRALCGSSVIYEPQCGRPLGLIFDQHKNLYVADAYKGILKIPRNDPTNVQVVVNEYEGAKFKFTNSLVLLSDEKTLYFTDTSTLYPRYGFVSAIISNRNDGRLFKFNLETNEIELVINDLHFANGIAVSPSEDFLVVCETSNRRIRRYYLKGPHSGTNDIFVSDIGGYPDNIKSDGNGNYYVGLFSEESAEISAVQEYEKIKQIFLQHVPPLTALSMAKTMGLVKTLDKQGKIIGEIVDPTGEHIAAIAEAEVHHGYLYLGSVLNPFIGRVDLSSLQ